MSRRLLRAALYLTATVVVLIGLAFVALQTDPVKDRIRRVAVDRANRYLNGELSIGHLGGSLFDGVTLDNVSLTQRGETVLVADRITVRYSILAIARRGVILDDISITNPRIRIAEGDSGWNVASLLRLPSRKGGEPATFEITNIHVTGGDVTVAPRTTASRRLLGAEFDLRLVQKAGTLTTTLSRFSAREERSGVLIESLSGAFDQSLKHIDATFALSADRSRMTGKIIGEPVASGREIRGDVDVTNLDLSRLFGDTSWVSDITGHAGVRASLPSNGTPASMVFDFTGGYAEAFGYQGRDLVVTGEMADNRLRFKARGDGYGAALTIDATWHLAGAGPVKAGFSGTGTFRRLDLTRLPPRLAMPPFSSNLGGRFRVGTDAGGWRADVVLNESRFEDATIGAGTTGHVDGSRGVVRYEAEGTLDGMNVRRLAGPLELPLLAEPRFESRLSGAFDASGRVGAPITRQLTAHARLTDSTVGETVLSAMALGVVLDGRRLAIDANGDFDGLTDELAGLSSAVDFKLTGTADAELVLHDIGTAVTAESLDVSGQVTLGPSTVRGVTLTAATIDGELMGGLATVRTFTADLSGVHATARGTAAIGSTGESSLEVTLSADDLAVLGKALGVPLSGSADLVATVTGSADRPHATGTLNGHTLAYGDRAAALTLNTTFTADLPDRNIELLIAEGRSEGTFLQAAGFEIISMETKASYQARQLTLESHLEEAERTLDLSGVVGLESPTREIALRRMQVQTGGTTWSMPEGQQARVGLGADVVSIDGLVFGHEAQRVAIAGAFALGDTPSAPAEGLILTVTDVELADVNSLLLGTRTLAGVVNGKATISGSAKAPVVDATLAITNGAVEGVSFEAVRGSVKYAGDRASVDLMVQQTAANHLAVTGTVPVSSAPGSAGALDLRVVSTPIDLGLAQAFTREITAIGGTGVFDIRVSGTMQAPVVDGTVTIADGAFALGATGVQYRNMTAAIDLDRNHLRISQFSLQDDDGHVLSAEGGLDVLGVGAPQTLDVKVTANDFHVLNNRMGNVQINAALAATGDFTHPRLAGQVRVERGRIEVDNVLEMTTKNVYSTTPQVAEDASVAAGANDAAPDQAAESGTRRPPQPAAPTSAFDRLDLDVQVRMPDNLILRGRDLRAGGSSVGLGDMNVVAGGTLALRKPMGARMSVIGGLQILRGYYSFQGRRFEVQRESIVRFRGDDAANPAIDVTADREISGVSTSVHIQGTANRPTIDLSSQPSLDDGDILSLIVFGQTTNDLGRSERASLGETAAAMAAGAIATPLADSVARALNLDLFEIEAPANSAPVVSLGSQIGSRLYVGLKQEIGSSDSSTVSFEWRIASVLRFVTSVVQGAIQKNAGRRSETSGVDLIFVYRY